MKGFFIGGGLIVLALLGWSMYARSSDPNLVARTGLHWHAMLSILVGTTSVPVPASIGLGAVEMPIHTHDDSGEIHMEFPGIVRTGDLELKHVFENWGRPMDSFGTNMTMTVNGATSTAYGNYVMHDGDVIVLHYN